jgi:hypothetical protein
MYSLDVKCTPIQLWVRKTDGSVWGWKNLPQGNWLRGPAASNIVAAWLAGTPPRTTPSKRPPPATIVTWGDHERWTPDADRPSGLVARPPGVQLGVHSSSGVAGRGGAGRGGRNARRL